jgi:NitT/TauT family transport system permease protein
VRPSEWRGRALTIVAPVAWGVLFLFAWEQFVNIRNIRPFLLPTPSRIWDQIWANFDAIREATLNTGSNALWGLVLGSLAGLGVAFVAQRFSFVKDLIAPLSAALNTMPIVALAPVFYNLFGTTSLTSRRVVVALVVFFPVFVNVLKGLTQVDPVHRELMKSYAASDSSFLRLVRVPNALPYFLTGLRISSSLAVIAAIVVEYFGGLQNGLGYRVTSAMKNSATARGWAYITAACALGLLFFTVAVLLERVAMPWHRHRRDT